MKQREKCSGRGFDSRQVHHKVYSPFPLREVLLNRASRWDIDKSILYNGPAMVSTGQQVNEWTAR